MPDEPEAGVAGQMREVVRMTGDEIVDADDLMFVVEKAVAEVRAEKTGGAGDDDPHAPAFTVRDVGDFGAGVAAASGPRPIE